MARAFRKRRDRRLIDLTGAVSRTITIETRGMNRCILEQRLESLALWAFSFVVDVI